MRGPCGCEIRLPSNVDVPREMVDENVQLDLALVAPVPLFSLVILRISLFVLLVLFILVILPVGLKQIHFFSVAREKPLRLRS